MKRKKRNPKQWSFEQCVEFTINALGDEDRKALIDGVQFDWHSTLGRWIRNNCELWKHGTDRCVADIVREYKAGRLFSPELDRNRFVHPELSFNLENVNEHAIHIDCTLAHPDNCSAVILNTVFQRVCGGGRFHGTS